MGRPLRRAVAGLGRPRSVDPRCALRGDHGSELPCRAHQEAAHCAPLPRRQLTARREATTVMSGVRSRHHTGSVWATPSGSRWATVDTRRSLYSLPRRPLPRRALHDRVGDPTRVETWPASLGVVITGELKVVALPRHAALNVTDATPRVEPRMQG